MTKVTQYERGRRIEHKIISFLKKSGYSTFRSAGSKGAFDIIAVNERVVRFIQSKLTDDTSYNYTNEIKNMNTVATPDYASRELWIYVARLGFVEIKTTRTDMEFENGAKITHLGNC